MNELIALIQSWAAGTDCRDQIHDCLIDMGYPNVAKMHFTKKDRCTDPEKCDLPLFADRFHDGGGRFVELMAENEEFAIGWIADHKDQFQ